MLKSLKNLSGGTYNRLYKIISSDMKLLRSASENIKLGFLISQTAARQKF